MTAEERRKRLSEVSRRGISVPPMVYADIERETPSHPVREWSWWSAIWERPRAAGWSYSEQELTRAQESWDASERFVQDRDAYQAEREAEETARQQERDAEAAKRDAEKQEQLAKTFRAGYFSIPGATEEGFQKALPELLEHHRREAALSGAGAIASPISARDMLGG
jgi:hypothetical protein